jgi:hypothetical protein
MNCFGWRIDFAYVTFLIVLRFSALEINLNLLPLIVNLAL